MTQLPSMADEPAASCNVEETVTLVQEVFEQPTVTAARFLPLNDDSDSLSECFGDARGRYRLCETVPELTTRCPRRRPTSGVHLSYSQRSLSAQTKRNLTQTVHLSPSGGRVQFRSPIVEVSSDIKHTAVSPDGQLHALFRAIPAKEAKESRRIVEIVETASGRRVDELDVTKEHGEWYFDGESPAYLRARPHPDPHALQQPPLVRRTGIIGAMPSSTPPRPLRSGPRQRTPRVLPRPSSTIRPTLARRSSTSASRPFSSSSSGARRTDTAL